MRALVTATLLVGLLLTGCATPPDPPQEASTLDVEEIQRSIRMVMEAQEVAWNAGDIEGFMAGYAAIDSLRFASGGDVAYGWQTTLDRYQQGYPDRAAMGTLAFNDLDIRVLSEEHALVFGGWQLAYPEADREAAGGLFTLLFERTPAGWRVVHDHTSSQE